jgi:hypothetical protein
MVTELSLGDQRPSGCGSPLASNRAHLRGSTGAAIRPVFMVGALLAAIDDRGNV